MKIGLGWRSSWLLCAGIALIALVAYMRIHNADFVQWDDGEFVTENERIQRLTPETLRDIFRVKPMLGPQASGQYVPLTLLSFALEHRLFGLDPRPYHIDNVVLHALNSGMVFWLVLLLLNPGVRDKARHPDASATFIAATTAVFFAVHPLHVESVAWVSQRKDVLSGFFYLLAMLMHELGWRRGRTGWPALVTLIGVCALMSKPTAVTLPVVLLLQDYLMGRLTNMRVIAAKLPLFVAACCIGAANSYTQRLVGALSPYRVADWRYNLLLAAKGVTFYIEKTFFPAQLCAIYPAPRLIGYLDPDTILAVGMVLLLLIVALLARQRQRVVTFCIMFFFIALAPMAQLVPTGLAIAAADRFFYLPSLGVLLLLGWLLDRARCAGYGKLIYTVPGVVAVVWLALTIERSGVWLDSFRLWADTARKTPNNELVYNNFGLVMAHRGRMQEARDMFERSLGIASNSYALINLGMWHLRAGNTNAAHQYLAQGERMDPANFEMRYARAIFEFNMTNYSAVAQYLTDLARERPLASKVRLRLGAVHMLMAQTNRAIALLKQALQNDAASPGLYLELGQLYEQNGEFLLAEQLYASGAAQFPKHEKLLYRRGVALSKLGKHGDACKCFLRYVGIVSTNSDAWSNLALCYRQIGTMSNAFEASRRAVTTQSASAEALYNHACLEAQAGNVAESVAALRLAVTKRPSLRAEALRDPDFAALRANAEFRALVATPASATNVPAEPAPPQPPQPAQ